MCVHISIATQYPGLYALDYQTSKREDVDASQYLVFA